MLSSSSIQIMARFHRNLAILLVCGLFMLTCFPSIECLFKLVKKKKFMEGFLVGFLVGNEYAVHKSPGKAPPIPMHMPSMPGMSMGSYDDDLHSSYHYMPKKSDRAYRVKPTRIIRQRNRRSKLKRILKFPVYIRKTH